VDVRLLQAADRQALESFYASMPSEELVQMERNPCSAGVIQEWLDCLDGQDALHLVAQTEQGLVVGHCLVHHPQRGWKAHQGQISVRVLPGWRHKALATRLIEEMVQVCLHSGLDLLVAEFLPAQESARNTFSRNGFHHLVAIPHFVRDSAGQDHDLLMMVRHIRDEEFFAVD
jgi:L-amino acid N-acyltransferase YncA